jgi:hypothetical protein
MTIAIDGTAKTPTGNYANPGATSTLTTSVANDLLVLAVTINGLTVNTDSIAITDTGGHTWTFRASSGGATSASPVNAGINNQIFEFETVVSGTFSGTITVTVSPGAGVSFVEAIAWGVSGENTGTPFDTNGSVPAAATSGSLSVSTSNANDLIWGALRTGGAVATVIPTGWTNLITADFTQAYYKIVSATQSGLTVPDANSGGGNGGANNGIIGDAAQQAAAAILLQGNQQLLMM